jgi:hypothetical protein
MAPATRAPSGSRGGGSQEEGVGGGEEGSRSEVARQGAGRTNSFCSYGEGGELNGEGQL